MKKICEMTISDLFWLSSGDVAIVGELDCEISDVTIRDKKAFLYQENKKIEEVNIIGEDKFFNVNHDKLNGRRSLRTNSDIPKYLKEEEGLTLVVFE